MKSLIILSLLCVISICQTPPFQITAGLIAWPGYMGGYYYNNPDPNTNLSYFMRDDNVELTLSTFTGDTVSTYLNGTYNIMDLSVDQFALLSSQLPGARMLFCTDWSQGGDMIIVKSQITSIAQLKGAIVAAYYYPLLVIALQNNGIEPGNITIQTYDTRQEAENAFYTNPNVVAIATYDPFEDEVLANVTGSYILLNSSAAGYQNTITDCFFANGQWIDSNLPAVTAFVKGWMQANQILQPSTNFPTAQTRIFNLYQSIYNVSATQATGDLANVEFRTLADNQAYFNVGNNNTSNNTFDFQIMNFASLYNSYGIANPPISIQNTFSLKEIRPLCGFQVCATPT